VEWKVPSALFGMNSLHLMCLNVLRLRETTWQFVDLLWFVWRWKI